METFKHKRYRKETKIQALRSELEAAKSLLERYHLVLVIYANQANWITDEPKIGPELAQKALHDD